MRRVDAVERGAVLSMVAATRAASRSSASHAMSPIRLGSAP
jgi:hypothetical protein